MLPLPAEVAEQSDREVRAPRPADVGVERAKDTGVGDEPPDASAG